MPQKAAYPKPRWIHAIDATTNICLAKRQLDTNYPSVQEGGGPPPAPADTDGDWVRWFKLNSRTLFYSVRELNRITVWLNQQYQQWKDFNPNQDVLAKDDAATWDNFKAASGMGNMIDLQVQNFQIQVATIKAVLNQPYLAWPPLTHNDINGKKLHASARRDWISNNSADIVEATPPFQVDVRDGIKTVGLAKIVFVQDCIWPNAPAGAETAAAAGTNSNDDWRSWGIVTNFSVEMDSTSSSSDEPESSSSSSSYYSTPGGGG